jgi:hypothetical protein
MSNIITLPNKPPSFTRIKRGWTKKITTVITLHHHLDLLCIIKFYKKKKIDKNFMNEYGFLNFIHKANNFDWQQYPYS